MADGELTALERDPKRAGRWRAVRKTLGLLEHDPHAAAVHTYEYRSLRGANGEKVYESYVEPPTTAAAHRVFWHHGPKDGYLTILAVTGAP